MYDQTILPQTLMNTEQAKKILRLCAYITKSNNFSIRKGDGLTQAKTPCPPRRSDYAKPFYRSSG